MAEKKRALRELTGDVPAAHVKVDNMNATFKTLVKSIDAKRDQDTFSAIANIIKQYKNDYNKELSDRNKHLVRYIYQNERQFLQDFIDNEDNFLDLKEKIETQVGKQIEKDSKTGITVEKAQTEIVNAVKKAIVAAIRDCDSKSAKTKGKVYSKTGIAKKQLAEIAKTAFRSTFVGKEYRAIVDDMKKSYVDKSRKIYTDRMQAFKDNIAALHRNTSKRLSVKKRRGTGGRKSGTSKGKTDSTPTARKKTNLINKNLSSGPVVLSTQELSMGRKLSGWIIRRFNLTWRHLHRNRWMDLFLKTTLKVGKFVGTIGSTIGKALAASLKFVAKSVVGITKGAFKILGWIKNHVVMKLFGYIGNLFTSMVHSPLTKSFFAVMFSPAGMFALGYFTAWMWNKIKKTIPKVEDFFVDKKDGFMDTVEWVVDTISDITDTVKQFIGDIADIAKDFTKGFGKFLKGTKNVVKTFFDFLNPGLIGFLLGSLVTVIVKVRSNPLFKVVKHLKGMAMLVGLGAVLLINVLSNIFASRDEAGTKYVENGLKQYSSINRSKSNELAVSSLTESDLQKFKTTMRGMDDDIVQVQELNDALKVLEKTELGGTLLTDNDNKTNLFYEFPALFSGVYSSAVFGNEPVPRELKDSTSAIQLRTLAEYLSYRIEKLKILKTAMYSATNVKQIEGLLKNFSFTESKNADGETEYNLGGASVEFNDTLMGKAERVVNPGGYSKNKKRQGQWNAATSTNEQARSLIGNQYVEVTKSYGTTSWQEPATERDKLMKYADTNDQESIDIHFFKTEDKNISAKLKSVDGDASGRTNLEKIKVMMGHDDVIRFKHATNEDKNKMIDEFLAKYKEREMTRIKQDKTNYGEEIKKLERAITIKKTVNSDLVEAIEAISPWVKNFKKGVETGSKAVGWAL